MNKELLIPLLTTSLITVIGWFILHQFSKYRDRENKIKELRVNYLINAWRRLEFASNREENDRIESIEKPIADIQLFGTKKQIELAQKFSEEIANNGVADLDEILIELRADLRKELKMEKVPNKLKFLRFTKKDRIPTRSNKSVVE